MSSSLPLPQVLAVDDNAANLLALEAMLAPLEQVLVKAQSGAAALREVLRAEFALILLDVQMDGLDGFATAELIRARARSRHIPIMFLTAKDRDPRLVARGYNVGAVDYIQKPVDPEILRSKVRVFLELHRKNSIIGWQAERIRQASQRELADQKRQSEDRYRTLADSMPQLVWTADAQGVLRYKNRRWLECAPIELSELHFAHVVHPEDLPIFMQRWTDAVRSGQAFSAEYRFASARQNSFRWHLVRAAPELDSNEQVVGWVGTSTDIDDRKRAEDALRVLASTSQKLATTLGTQASLQEALENTLPLLGDVALLDVRTEPGKSNRLRAIAEGIAVPPLEDPRFCLGPDTVVFSGRPEIHTDVARELVELRSRRGDQISQRALEQLQFLQDSGVLAYICLPLTSRDRVLGSLTYLMLESRRRYSSEVIALASDLARRFATALDNLRLYEIARSERAKHEEVSRAKDVFLATLSHELRTPLNAVLGWIQLIRSGALGEDKFDHAVETVDRNARALERLLVDLLDVSRIVAGNLSVEHSDVDISGVLTSAVDAARPAAQGKRIELIVDVPPNFAWVAGDAGRLHQVVSNLLTNAIKFTPAEGRVQIRLERDDNSVRILVIDSGEGIAPDFLPYVFDHFRQAHNSNTHTAGGLGLGLAIVKHLVELHGGRVQATSDGQGKGSTFTVELPLERDGDAGTAVAQPRRDSIPASGSRHKNLAGVHALVVEDDEDGRELLRTVLNGYGAIVTTVGTARAALAAIAERPPDVLISDIGLPDEDGFALIQKVRADGHAGLPAIAVTAYVSQSDVGRAFGAGFQAHLPKPIQPTALGAAVARLVGR